MSPSSLPIVYIVRHGATEWSKSGQHTSSTDLPLLDEGKHQANQVYQHLKRKGIKFGKVYCSPLIRAKETCGILIQDNNTMNVEYDENLKEWNYGDFEGKTTAEIRQKQGYENWNVFLDGCPNGESPEAVGKRADLVLQKLYSYWENRSKSDSQPSLIVSHGHFSRVLVARFLQLHPKEGRHFILDTATINILGFEHNKSEPCIKTWNMSVNDL